MCFFNLWIIYTWIYCEERKGKIANLQLVLLEWGKFIIYVLTFKTKLGAHINKCKKY